MQQLSIPSLANFIAKALPIPLLAPVIQITFFIFHNLMYNRICLKNKFLSFILFALVTYSASVIGGLATIRI